jgi:hypothetical protein
MPRSRVWGVMRSSLIDGEVNATRIAESSIGYVKKFDIDHLSAFQRSCVLYRKVHIYIFSTRGLQDLKTSCSESNAMYQVRKKRSRGYHMLNHEYLPTPEETRPPKNSFELLKTKHPVSACSRESSVSPIRSEQCGRHHAKTPKI